MLLDKFLALEASAGSGKTFNLVSRYLLLLFRGEDSKNILALTYTNKAANEMYDRILYTLVHDDSFVKYKHEICKELSFSEDEVEVKRSEILKNFLRTDVKVNTIDSFFVTILRSFSLHKSLSPDFEVVNKFKPDKLLENFLTELDINSKLSEFSKFLADINIKINILLDIFGELYLKEKEFKYSSSIDINLNVFIDEIFEKYKKIGNFFLKTNISNTGIKTLNKTKLEDILSLTFLLKDSLKDYAYYKKYYEPEVDNYFIELKETIKNYFIAKENIQLSKFYSYFTYYKRARDRMLRDSNTLSFDDVKVYVYELLRGELNSDFLYFRLDSYISHILYDEFQDTNTIEIDIFRPIIEEFMSSNEYKSFFFVGDKKQTIYRFRGSNEEVFDYSVDYFKMNKMILENNYRSNKLIVDFLNETFRNKFSDYSDQKSVNNLGGYIEIKEPISKDMIVNSVVSSVKMLLEHGIKESDIAILVNKNSESLVIKEELEYNGISSVIEASSNIFEHHSIKIITLTLQYIYFKKDIYKRGVTHYIKRDLDFNFNINCDLLTLAREIIVKFNLVLDADLLNFMELLANYRDLVDFIFDIKNIDAELSNYSLGGINILTKHKSKGLEFKHVIIFDSFKQGNNKKSSLLFDYSGIDLKGIYVNDKKSLIELRRRVDSNYNEIYTKSDNLDAKNDLNLLYVAFSRAKESLILIPKDKNGELSVLNLRQGVKGEVLTQKRVAKEEKIKDDFLYSELSYGVQDNFLQNDNMDDDFIETSFGIATHLALQNMNYYNISSIDDGIMVAKSKHFFNLSSDRFIDLKNRLITLCNNEQFKSIIDSSVNLYKELPIAYMQNIYYIDLLVEYNDSFCVIDYKTGDNSRFKEKNSKQVALYCEAVNNITNKRCKGLLIYILKNGIKIEEVI